MTEDIICPKCGSEMIVRTAKKGPNAGRRFHVCTRYPECKGKVPLPSESEANQQSTEIGAVENSRTSSRGVDAVTELERLRSDSYGEFLDQLEGYLRHHDLEIVREVVASRYARSGGVAIANALIDLLGSDNQSIAREAAKAIWESRTGDNISDKVNSLKFHLRSLRTEYEIPYKMSQEGARQGLGYLREVLPSDEAKKQFDDLVAEIWSS